MQLLTLACGRQVSAGVTTKPGSSATFMDPKLTSARHTLVLHPLTDFSPSIRSYIYSKLLDVWRLKELQVMCPSVQSRAHPGGMRGVMMPSQGEVERMCRNILAEACVNMRMWHLFVSEPALQQPLHVANEGRDGEKTGRR